MGLPAPLDPLHDPLARIPRSGWRCPSVTSELRVARAQGRGPASHLLRDQAGDSEAVLAVGGGVREKVC